MLTRVRMTNKLHYVVRGLVSDQVWDRIRKRVDQQVLEGIWDEVDWHTWRPIRNQVSRLVKNYILGSIREVTSAN